MNKRPIIDKPSGELLKRLTDQYSKKDLSGAEADEKARKIIEFLENNGITIEKFNPKNFSVFDESQFDDKKSYPNYDQYQYVAGQHDVKKWLLSVKNIYYKQKSGLSYKEAVIQSTGGWKKMEIYDFLNWLRYYEEGSHMKYKFANVWYENGQPGYFLHIKQDEVPSQDQKNDEQAADEIDRANKVNEANKAHEESERNAEKKVVIEKQRQKIIGRLDSAEKLLRSEDGQLLAGKELENLMEAIYNLKKKVQLVNKLSVSTRLYEDMIVREANILSRKGFVKAANLLYSVAQTPAAAAQAATGTPGGIDNIPDAASPQDPSGAGNPGPPGTLPAQLPGVPDANTSVNTGQPPVSAIVGSNAPDKTTETSPAIIPQSPPPDAQPEGIKNFITNMNDGNQTDNLEVDDPEEQLMVSEAQAAPGIPPAALEDVPITDTPLPNRGNTVDAPDAPKTPKTQPKDESLEVSEKDLPSEKPIPGSDPAVPRDSTFDAKMDAMLASVTLADIVTELEDVAKIFKVREISRRLSLIDMMLDNKGILTYFPQLSEAQSKNLDNSNYCGTRIEDVLAKLRGSLKSKDIDLEGGPTPSSSPEIDQIKGKLQTDQDKEKQRKQMRKDQENSELEAPEKETPEVEMGELGAPPVAPKPPAPNTKPI